MAIQDRAAPSPAIGDPVVVDGRKYRIRSIARAGQVDARTSFGNQWATVDLAELRWDGVAGVWRVAAPETEAEAREAFGK